MNKNMGLYLFVFIFAMSFSCVFSNEIVLKIYPKIKLQSLNTIDKKKISYIKTTLEGFNKDQFALRNSYCFDVMGALNVDIAVRYSGELKPSGVIVRDGRIDVYPFDWHRKFYYLASDDYLTIKMRGSEGDGFVKVEMPEIITKRLLRSFLHNTQECWCCAHFLQALIWQGEEIAIDGFLDFGWERLFSKSADGWKFIQKEVDEDSLKPGDGIILYSEDWMSCFNLGKIRIKHFALALGSKLYISKAGNNGVICVQDMDSMMKLYGTTGFCRVEMLDIKDPENSDLEEYIEKECGFFGKFFVGAY